MRRVHHLQNRMACGSKELDRPLSRFPLRGQAGAGGFPPRRPTRCVASKQRWHASCAGSPHKRAAAPLCIPCEHCRAGLETSETTRICGDPERQKRIKDGRHVGLDFYDLLIEPILTNNAALSEWRAVANNPIKMT